MASKQIVIPPEGGGSAGVSSVNSLTGAVTLAAGTNVTITPSGNTLTIASSGGGSGITQLTGDVTAGPGSGSQATTLATVNSNVGSFGSASSVATLTANAKGLVTAAGSTSIQIAESQVTNLVSDLAGKQAVLGFTPVNKAGDTMTGDLKFNSSVTPTANIINSDGSASFLTGHFIINTSETITGDHNPTIDVTSAPDETLVITGAMSVTGGFSSALGGFTVDSDGFFNSASSISTDGNGINLFAPTFIDAQCFDGNQVQIWDPALRTFQDLTGQDAITVDDGSQNTIINPATITIVSSQSVAGPTLLVQAPGLDGGGSAFKVTIDSSSAFNIGDSGVGHFFSGLIIDTSLNLNSVASNQVLGTDGGSLVIAVTDPTFTGTTSSKHFSGTGTSPTIAAGTGAGTSPTVSIVGKDSAGAVSVTTGTLPTGTNAAVATITFNSAYVSAPYVVLYPANAATAALSGVSMTFITSTTTTFVITSGTTALTAATAYKWNYHVIQ